MVRMILFCWLFVLQNDKIFSQDYSMIWNGKKSSITKEFFNNNCNGKSFTYSWEDKQSVVTALSNKILTSKNVLTFTFGTNIVEFDARGEELDLNRGTRSSYGSGEHHSAIFTYRISGEDIIVDYTRLEYAGGGSRYGQIKTFSINEILNIMEISTNELRNLISIERIKFLQNNDLLYINNKFLKMNESHSFWDLIEGGRKDLAVALKIPNNDLTYLNENGETPLHYGAKSNELSLVKKLITKGVDIDEQDFDGNTPLSLALKNNANEELIFLLTNKSNERCSYALFSYSIRNNNINLINRCIDEKVPYDIYDDNIDYKTFKYEVFEILNSSASIRISLNRIIENHFSSILNNEDNYLFINKSLSGDMPYIPTSSELESLMNKNDIFTLYVKNKTFKKLFLSDDKYELYGVQNDVRLTLLSVKPLKRSMEYIDQLVDPESENFDYIIDKMILNTIFTNKKELTTHLINKKFENTKNPSMLNDYNYNNILYECLDRNFITNSKLLIQNYNFDDTVWKLARANQNAKVINRLNKIFKTFPNKKNLMTTDAGIYKEEFQPEYALNSFEGWRQYGYDKKNKLAYKKSRLKIERDIETAEKHRIALETIEKQNQMEEKQRKKEAFREWLFTSPGGNKTAPWVDMCCYAFVLIGLLVGEW